MAQVYELNLRDYWRIIRKRKFIIIVSVVMAMASSLLYTNVQTPLYRAMASVKVEPRRMMEIGVPAYEYSYQGGNPLTTESNVITSRPIAEEAAKRLTLITADTPEMEREAVIDEIQNSITTEQIAETNIISIIVTLPDPKRAAGVASQIAQVYVEENLKAKSKKATQVREYVEKQLAKVEAQLNAAEEQRKKFKETQGVTGIAVAMENKLVELHALLSELLTRATEKHPQVMRLKEQIQELQKQLKAMPSSELEFARLTRDVGVNEKLYTMLRERFEETRITEAENVGDASVVSLATVPKNPINFNRRLGIVFGGILGIMLGLAAAFIMENLDTSIGTIEDVESLLKVSVLAVIPHVSVMATQPKDASLLKRIFWKQITPASQSDEAKTRLIAHYKPTSPVSEAYRALRTNIKFSPQKKSILITSAGPREGKSSVLINLGITAAQSGSKTLIISTDLRKPTIYHTFGLKREPGVYEVLSGSISLDKAVRGLSDILMGKMGFDEAVATPGLGNLHILTTGHLTNNPAELLSSVEMTNLIKEIHDKFDVILYDSPPVLPITDAAIIGPQCDGVILVYEVGRTARSALLRTKQQLESVGCKIIGVVLNHVRQETAVDSTYHYYHYRYYGSKKEKEANTV